MKTCLFQSARIASKVGVGKPFDDRNDPYVKRKLGIFICNRCVFPNFGIGVCWVIDKQDLIRIEDPQKWAKMNEVDSDWYYSS